MLAGGCSQLLETTLSSLTAYFLKPARRVSRASLQDGVLYDIRQSQEWQFITCAISYWLEASQRSFPRSRGGDYTKVWVACQQVGIERLPLRICHTYYNVQYYYHHFECHINWSTLEKHFWVFLFKFVEKKIEEMKVLFWF